MQFNSHIFYVFIILVLALCALTPRQKRWLPLLLASCIFYGWWRVDYLLLIFLSTLVDYIASICIEKTELAYKKKLYLGISLVLNLGTLIVFKYAVFFNDIINVITKFIGLNLTTSAPNLILPVGISFYTFQTLSYSIDVYRGHLKAERHPGRFALYVVFFPQLVAGPIERATKFLPQLQNSIQITWNGLSSGARLFSWGLFKKIVLADRLSIFVDEVYGHPQSHHGFAIMLATVFFAFQIYCDFSGYSDMARGCARIFGITLMENFKMPYLADSIKVFWERWHISLSTWFKDYLYIPLGGNALGTGRTYVNLWIVFLISGLWHGANWTYVLWGALHGTLLTCQNLWTKLCPVPIFTHPCLKNLKILFTFILICICWIPFRASSLSDVNHICTSIFTGPFFKSPIVGLSHYEFFLVVIFTLSLITIEWHWNNIIHFLNKYDLARWCSYYLLLFCIYFFSANSSPSFIYFQF